MFFQLFSPLDNSPWPAQEADEDLEETELLEAMDDSNTSVPACITKKCTYSLEV